MAMAARMYRTCAFSIFQNISLCGFGELCSSENGLD